MNTDFLGNGAVRIAIIGVLAILALFLLVETINGAQNLGRPANPPTNTITVSGTGTASLAPDIAHITYGVEKTGASVAEAQKAATDANNAAFEAVKKLGIADADIRTESYNVSPQYEAVACRPGMFCPPQSSRIVGYQVSETIDVKVRDLDKASDILQTLGTLGVENITGPDFGLDNPTAGTDAARQDAINHAKAQAETLAHQLGVHLGKVVSFNEGGNAYPVMYKAATGAVAQDSAAVMPASPTLPTGQNTYTDSVSITYEIW